MKFVDVTYGTKGDTGLYTYAVNNSVRVGDILQVSVRHYKNGRIFGTTAITQKTGSQNSVQGQEMKQQAQENARGGQIAEALTSKDLGIGRTRTAQGRYAYEGVGKTVKDGDRYVTDPNQEFVRTNRIQAVRGANILSRQAQTAAEISKTPLSQQAVETFDSYSKQFMPKGEQ